MAGVGVQQLLSQVLSRFETVSRIAVAQRAPQLNCRLARSRSCATRGAPTQAKTLL